MGNLSPTRDYHHGTGRALGSTQPNLGDHSLEYRSGPSGSPVFPPAASASVTTFHGGDGNDHAFGYTYMYGNDGHDWLITGTEDYAEAYGGAGDDMVWLYYPGFGSLFGGDGNDSILASEFDDDLYGGKGNDYLFDDIGHDHMRGGSGRDRLETNDGGRLYGGTGHDSGTIRVPVTYQPTGKPDYEEVLAGLYGGSADDQLYGGSGDDILEGNGGRDILVGGSGIDNLTGGGNSDVFRYESVTDSRPGLSTRDVIRDFGDGADSIDLTRIDADTAAAGDQAFTLIGAEQFHGVAGELRYRNGIAGGDVNGDGAADFEIKIEGAAVADDEWAL